MAADRFEFIGHALRGDGPFRPRVSHQSDGVVATLGPSYLVQYPRESAEKYARRNQLAWYSSPLAQACSRFVGHLSTRSPVRDLPHPLYEVMAQDIDGRGNGVDGFFQQFMTDAKARGSMLLLVDMPEIQALSMEAQIQMRNVPFWVAINPESVIEYELGDNGKFVFVTFSGNYLMADGSRVECIYRYDLQTWSARKPNEKVPFASGEHRLGECPMLIFTEAGSFPYFGPFASIADLSKRLFNLDSELDEILRSQTFSLLTMQVPDGTTDAQKLAAAQTAGQTIGTSNLLVHSGSTPQFIAPTGVAASVYMDRIKSIHEQISRIGLDVASVNQQESGLAMQMRFQTINAELSKFAARMEDLERRAWELSRRWLRLSSVASVQWSRDYSIADVESELRILTEMQASAVPAEMIAEQQRKLVSVQFSGLDQERKDEIYRAIDERIIGAEDDDDDERRNNVVPLRPDPDDSVREAIVRALNNG